MSRLAIATAVGLACALHVTAAPAAAQVSDPAHEVGEPLWISGLSVFVATYVITGAAATTLVMVANARMESIGESWIPLVGPYVMLADSAGYDSMQLAFTGISAALQTLGCAAMIVGIVLDAQPDPAGAGAAMLRLAPMVGSSGSGLSLSGRF